MSELNEIYDAISVSELKIINMQDLLQVCIDEEIEQEKIDEVQANITAEQEVLSDLESQRDALE
jgi:hypothetical protein